MILFIELFMVIPGFRVERGIKRRQMSRRYRCRFLPWVQQIRKLYPELICPNFNEIEIVFLLLESRSREGRTDPRLLRA